MKKYLFFLFASAFTLLHGQSLLTKTWIADQMVRTVVQNGNTIYLGGEFKYVGPNTPYGAVLNVNSGLPDLSFARANGQILCAAPDGSGGWYIGGSFTEVGGQVRNRLAHLYANGSVSAWNPNASNTVRTLVVINNTVYVGGGFTTVGGQSRRCLAALDTTAGTATAWNPNLIGYQVGSINYASIATLVVSGNLLYIGGQFTNVGSQARTCLATLDIATGLISTLNINVNSSTSAPEVSIISVNGNTVYIGGNFTSVGSLARSTIAAVDIITSSVTSWNPTSNSLVKAIVANGSKIYVGGYFTNIGGQLRNYIAAIDSATGLATSWNPNVSFSGTGTAGILAIAINSTNIYAGGNFTNIGGQARQNFAEIDTTTGLATSKISQANDMVSFFTMNGSKMYAGGSFTSIGGQIRNYLAAVDASTGIPTSWNPNPTGDVYTLAVKGSNIYVGGQFAYIGGQQRTALAAVDSTTGLANAWNPNQNVQSSVTSKLFINGNTIYAGTGGTGYTALANITAIDATTGSMNILNWSVNASIYDFLINNNTIYVSGGFINIGGQVRKGLAAFNTVTNAITSWDPNVLGGRFYRITAFGGNIYSNGYSTDNYGQTTPLIVALDTATALGALWNINGSGGSNILSLTASNNVLYIGGAFTSIGGQPRGGLAALDITTGFVNSWNPNATGTYLTAYGIPGLFISGNIIYAGGYFSNIGGYPSSNFAALSAFSSTPLPLRDISLQVQKNGNAAVLNWQVNAQENVAKYEIEKSADGSRFTSIGNVIATSNGQYKLTDAAPYITNFYRIKAVLKTGNSFYSKIVKLSWQGIPAITLYPNPGSGNELQLQLNNIAEGSYQLSIYNLAGQKIAYQNITHAGGSATITADISRIHASINIVTFTDKYGNVLMKQRWIRI